MGFSILLIILYHSKIPLTGALYVIKYFGSLGVEFFLILSGIGLYYSMNNIMTQNGNLLIFFKKRFERIIPATVICLTPWYIYLYRGNLFRGKINPGVFLLNITSLNFWIDGNNRGWFIALITVLYIIYPLLYFCINKFEKSAFKLTFLLIGASIILNVLIAVLFPQYYKNTNIALTRFPIFIIGSFMAIPVKNKKECSSLILLPCIIISGILGYYLFNNINELKAFYLYRCFYALISVCAVIILSFIFHIAHNTRIYKIFDFFGKHTLELYLTHTQILTVSDDFFKQRNLNGHAVTVNILAFVISLFVSVIIHRIIDIIMKKIIIKNVE